MILSRLQVRFDRCAMHINHKLLIIEPPPNDMSDVADLQPTPNQRAVTALRFPFVFPFFHLSFRISFLFISVFLSLFGQDPRGY